MFLWVLYELMPLSAQQSLKDRPMNIKDGGKLVLWSPDAAREQTAHRTRISSINGCVQMQSLPAHNHFCWGL